MVGLKKELESRGEEAPRPPGTLPPIDLSEQDSKAEHRTGRIEELMETLECPVCLDTADTPPVYQCPEGHLICKVNFKVWISSCPSLTNTGIKAPSYLRTAMPRWWSVPSAATLS